MDPSDPTVLYNVACLYAVLGRKEDAIEALEQSANKGSGDKAWLEHDSDLASLREEPRHGLRLRRCSGCASS